MGRDFNFINAYKMQSRMNELGMRQKDLAKKSGVSPMCISNVINGHVIPRVNTIKALELEIFALLGENKTQERNEKMKELEKLDRSSIVLTLLRGL